MSSGDALPLNQPTYSTCVKEFDLLQPKQVLHTDSTHSRLVIVCPRVHEAVGIVVVWEMDVGGTPSPGKLQNNHTRCPDGLPDLKLIKILDKENIIQFAY